mmetsp:Transcript_37020/g.55369  ORF Transcript_37020/g.55369 Transcript_37020/m.55369 type:complete len:84 (+) Transcript_37020:1622-1873(+)
MRIDKILKALAELYRFSLLSHEKTLRVWYQKKLTLWILRERVRKRIDQIWKALAKLYRFGITSQEETLCVLPFLPQLHSCYAA